MNDLIFRYACWVFFLESFEHTDILLLYEIEILWLNNVHDGNFKIEG